MIAEPLLKNPVPCFGEAFGSPRGCNLAPWEAEPYRLWSLWEIMEIFEPAQFFFLVDELRNMAVKLVNAHANLAGCDPSDRERLAVELKTTAGRYSAGSPAFSEVLALLGLRLSRKTMDKIGAALADYPACATSGRLTHLADEFDVRVKEELSANTFLYLEPREADTYVNPLEGWDAVIAAFPSAAIDIEEASKCMALCRYTACVFHLMRIMELALRTLAVTLNNPKIDPRNHPSWESILKKCRDELEKDRVDRAPEWAADSAFFAGVSANLMGVKEAWRNPTMHVGVSYTEERARDINTHVQSFMRHLATKLSEAP